MGGWLHGFVVASWLVSPPAAAEEPPRLHLTCTHGYTRKACDEHLRRLEGVLTKMDAAPLGEWTWLLVKSDTWKDILRRAGRDPDSPAFTVLDDRRTFLEEALFDVEPARTWALRQRWRMPIDQLLAFAVAHELGHALCRDTDEARTNVFADEMRRTGRASCKTP